MKKIYEKIKHKLILRTIPKVKNFKEAYSYCNKKNTLGYEFDFLCRYRFEKLANYIKNNKGFIFPQSSDLLLYCIAYFLKENKGNTPKIVDYGGACGENILFLKSIFGNDILKSSFVIETKAQVKESKKWNYSKKINFSNDLKKVLDENKIDIFFSSGSLSYIERPYEILSMIKNYKIPLICLTRNNFSKEPKSFIQVSNLADNGFGEHIKEYGNPKIWYPSQLLNETKIKKIFNPEYKLILNALINKTGVIKKNESYAKDLIFNIQSKYISES